MFMSKHTPGPWMNQNGQIRPTQGKGRTGGYAPLVKIHGDKRTTNDEINTANAHLIAAAPELLDALLTMPQGLHATDDELWAWQEKARNAIDKALGETS